tara:strand:- start:242 stop:1063 length:822 start_codon:yes stop_codon:yes gene_type:complete
MYRKIIFIFLTITLLYSCSKNEIGYEPKDKIDPYLLYNEGFEAISRGDYFYAEKKFSEAELNFEIIEYAAKSAIMSSYALYGINFYNQATENINRYLKKYPADSNVMYAHYLAAIIYYEQISDEKKDLKPLIEAKEKINFFLKKYPNSEYSLDLKFKKDLIMNQIAAKELYIAKFYISVQKWVPAIKRLKNIVNLYDKTIYIEEALHRLVEIHHYLGLEEEAKKYAKILGYNYNSSKWFEQTYVIINKDYKLPKTNNDNDKDSILKKIIKKIR